MLVYILWFVITIGPGHLLHVPMKDSYATKDSCKNAAEQLMAILQEQWPNDPNLEVYCKKETQISQPM